MPPVLLRSCLMEMCATIFDIALRSTTHASILNAFDLVSAIRSCALVARTLSKSDPFGVHSTCPHLSYLIRSSEVMESPEASMYFCVCLSNSIGRCLRVERVTHGTQYNRAHEEELFSIACGGSRLISAEVVGLCFPLPQLIALATVVLAATTGHTRTSFCELVLQGCVLWHSVMPGYAPQKFGATGRSRPCDHHASPGSTTSFQDRSQWSDHRNRPCSLLTLRTRIETGGQPVGKS